MEDKKMGLFFECNSVNDIPEWKRTHFGFTIAREKVNKIKELYMIFYLFKFDVIFGYRWLCKK